mgnify:CR=1 FL=1
MTVAEDAITTEEVLVVVSVVKEKALAVEEVQVAAVSVATEVQHQEAADSVQEKKVVFQIERHVKADLEAEANQEVQHHQDVKADFHPIAHQEDLKLQEAKVSQTEHLVVLKVHPMHQEKEDREEAKFLTLIPLTWEGIMELKISTFC